MESTDTQAPVRTAADALSDLKALIQAAAEHAIPVNIPHAIGLLTEHAELSSHEDVSGLAARVGAVEKLLTEAGIEAPAANAPQAL